MLSLRLRQILNQIPEGLHTIVDVGADHGQLSMAMIEEEKCAQVFSVEVAKGPLKRLKNNIASKGLTHAIKVYFGSGLSPINEAFDGVVIAGMGGFTMIEILKAHQERLLGHEVFILQPQSGYEELRTYLNSNGFTILDESLVKDDFLYEVWTVKMGTDKKYTREDLLIGPIHRIKKAPLFDDYIEVKTKQLTDKLSKIKDIKGENSKKRRQQLEEELQYYIDYKM